MGTPWRRNSHYSADDGLLAALEANWLQHALNVLVDIFQRMGLTANTTKTQTMTYFPGRISTGLSAEAYNLRVTGEGKTYRQRQQQRVNRPECGKNYAKSSLKHHRRCQHGGEPEINWNHPLLADQPAGHHVISFPRQLHTKDCPVPGCPASLCTKQGMRSHFSV